MGIFNCHLWVIIVVVNQKLNVRNHKVSFERAAEVFLDPLALSVFDEEHGDEEERWITIGKDSREVVLVVVHTFREVAADEWLIQEYRPEVLRNTYYHGGPDDVDTFKPGCREVP